MRILGLICALALLPISHAAHAQQAPRVRVETTMGSFVIELDPVRAPLSVSNFLDYVHSGHYQGTIFHRVISNFVAQAGGYDEKFAEKPTHASVPNESGNGLSNARGTVGMARTGDPHSGTSQFYVNLADNVSLDPKPSRWGYAVFGRIVEGMNVIDSIGSVATGQVGPFEREAPLKNVVIEKMVEISTAPASAPPAPTVTPTPPPADATAPAKH